MANLLNACSESNRKQIEIVPDLPRGFHEFPIWQKERPGEIIVQADPTDFISLTCPESSVTRDLINSTGRCELRDLQCYLEIASRLGQIWI